MNAGIARELSQTPWRRRGLVLILVGIAGLSAPYVGYPLDALRMLGSTALGVAKEALTAPAPSVATLRYDDAPRPSSGWLVAEASERKVPGALPKPKPAEPTAASPVAPPASPTLVTAAHTPKAPIATVAIPVVTTASLPASPPAAARVASPAPPPALTTKSVPATQPANHTEDAHRASDETARSTIDTVIRELPGSGTLARQADDTARTAINLGMTVAVLTRVPQEPQEPAVIAEPTETVPPRQRMRQVPPAPSATTQPAETLPAAAASQAKGSNRSRADEPVALPERRRVLSGAPAADRRPTRQRAAHITPTAASRPQKREAIAVRSTRPFRGEASAPMRPMIFGRDQRASLGATMPAPPRPTSDRFSDGSSKGGYVRLFNVRLPNAQPRWARGVF